MKTLMAILVAVGLGTSVFAQTNATPQVANSAKALIGSLTEKVEIGGTYAAWFDEDWKINYSPALTVMGVIWKKEVNERLEISSGLCYNYLTKADKHAVGLGASFAIFTLPKIIEDARESIPVVNTVTPKLLKIKIFAEIAIDAERIADPRPVFVGGLTIPF
jgi:hypothetical protein